MREDSQPLRGAANRGLYCCRMCCVRELQEVEGPATAGEKVGLPTGHHSNRCGGPTVIVIYSRETQ